MSRDNREIIRRGRSPSPRGDVPARITPGVVYGCASRGVSSSLGLLRSRRVSASFGYVRCGDYRQRAVGVCKRSGCFVWI